MEYYNLASQYLNKTKPENTDLATLYNNIGLLYYNKGDFENAKIEYEKAINLDSLYLLKPGLMQKLLDHLAMTNLKLGETTSVENDLTRALYIRDSIGDLEGLSLNYYNLSLISQGIRKYNRCLCLCPEFEGYCQRDRQ